MSDPSSGLVDGGCKASNPINIGLSDGSPFLDIRLLPTCHIMLSFVYIWHLSTLHSDETHSFSENLTRSKKISIDLRRSLLNLVRFALDLTDLCQAP